MLPASVSAVSVSWTGEGGLGSLYPSNVYSLVSVYASASSISQNLTYIVNPSYPANYVPSSTPSTLTYTVNKCSTDICRIRLDYDLFVLTAPLAAATTQGQCSTDVMTLATTAQTVVPTTTTYGQYPYLCGTNTGYHCEYHH